MSISKKIEQGLSGSSWIRAMFEEGEKLKKIYGKDKVFDFTLGNPCDEPPKSFKESLKKLADEPIDGMHKYMSNAGYDDTREAIANRLKAQSGLPLNSSHIIMTNGASGALNVALKTILNPNEEVIILTPFFVEYKSYIDNHGGIPVIVDTRNDFQIDINNIEKHINKNTKAIIINSPNNPTGVVYPASSLELLGIMLKQKELELGTHIYVISDEPYAKIVYDDIEVPSIYKYIDNSIVATSHSKDLGLAGERIGYLAVNPSAYNVDLLIEGMIYCNRILGFVNAPALMQRLITNLQNEKTQTQEYREKRDILYDNLTEMGFEMTKPQGAFYLFPKSPIPDDIEFVKIAQKYNILLVPGSGFGKPGYFRMAYCVDKQMILNSLDSFKRLAVEVGL